MKTRIKKFGFEIEGEFTRTLQRQLATHGEVKGDGSIHSCCSGLVAQEYNSKPLKISELKDVEGFFKTLQKRHDKKEYHWNDTMGFHVHLSFVPKIPPELLSMNFVNYFEKEMKKIFPQEYKERKGNTYCKFDITPRDLLRDTGDRYKAINFRPALSRHGTIEFRIFPSSSPDNMFQYLKFTIDVVKNFLNGKITTRIKLMTDLNRVATASYAETTTISRRDSSNHEIVVPHERLRTIRS